MATEYRVAESGSRDLVAQVLSLDQERSPVPGRLEHTRREAALPLLQHTNLNVADISLEFGYRDPAIFTRAFRRWTGTTPSRFRRALAVENN